MADETTPPENTVFTVRKERRFFIILFRIFILAALVFSAADFYYNIQTRQIWCPALFQIAMDGTKNPPPTKTGKKLFQTFYVVGRKYNCY